MTLPKFQGAYVHYKALMNRAAEEGPFKLPCTDRREAIKIRQRCYRARTLEREFSKKVYGPGEVGYDWTAYDAIEIIVRERNGKWYLIFRTGATGEEILSRQTEPLDEEDLA